MTDTSENMDETIATTDESETTPVEGKKRIPKAPCIVWANEDWRITYARKSWILQKKRIPTEGKHAGEEVWDTIHHAVYLNTMFITMLDRSLGGTLSREDQRAMKNAVELYDLAVVHTRSSLQMFHTFATRLKTSLCAEWASMMEGKSLDRLETEEIATLLVAMKDDAEVVAILKQWESLQTILTRANIIAGASA